MTNTPKVSVIIPVYGVETFVEHCAESLLGQTLDDVEFIFVDDASRDNSISLVKDVVCRFPDRSAQVKFIHHETNRGLPAARNTGLEAASGQYIFHCDSDDYVEPEMLETLYSSACENQADIVWCDWYLTFGQNERYMKQPSFQSPFEALKCMLGGGMKYNVWNKLVKRSLYTANNIRFPEGYGMGEDMTMMLLFAHAKQVAYVNKAFYHYVKLNSNAFSANTISEKHISALKHNVDYICARLSELYPLELEREIAYLKLESKFPFLVDSGKLSVYHKWNEWYPEANRYIFSNSNVSLRSRFIQQCARYKQYWIVWLHYQLLRRVVYGIIYH